MDALGQFGVGLPRPGGQLGKVVAIGLPVFGHVRYVGFKIVVDAAKFIWSEPTTEADDIRFVHYYSFEDVKDRAQERLH